MDMAGSSARWVLAGLTAAALASSVGACSGKSNVLVGEPGEAGEGSGASNGSGASHGDGGSFMPGLGGKGSGADNGSGGGGGSCESTERAAELAPIYLAFAFDVSGSMGHMDCPYWNHDARVKWDPVAAAVKEFFSDETSVNINGSLTLFPSRDDVCDESSYTTPDVTMRALPSNAFAAVLDGYEEEVDWEGSYDFPVDNTAAGAGPWRGGTPTRVVVDATVPALEALRTEHPDARVALVLVTDGLPQSCSNNGIDDVVDSVEAALEAGIPTYVIGVKDPETPPAEAPWRNTDDEPVWACETGNGWRAGYSDPDTPRPTNPNLLDDLNLIADAGGTDEAILVDTGDPAATKNTLRLAIDRIRAEAISCELERPPPPPGQTFDPNRVNVRYDSGADSMPLSFDEECESDDAWRYQGGDTSVIELCPSTCERIQTDPYAEVQVEFGCQRRVIVR